MLGRRISSFLFALIVCLLAYIFIVEANTTNRVRPTRRTTSQQYFTYKGRTYIIRRRRPSTRRFLTTRRPTTHPTPTPYNPTHPPRRFTTTRRPINRPAPTLPPRQFDHQLRVRVDVPLPCKPKPSCPIPSERFYSADGSCNNLLDGARGQAGRPHKRLVSSAYSDGTGKPRGYLNRNLPSARMVSVNMQESELRKSADITHSFVIWGQFLAHDLVLTPTVEGEDFDCDDCRTNEPACFNIQVPRNDKQRKACFPFTRSQQIPDDQCNTLVRQQSNNITPYIDGGPVYGNSKFQLDELLDGESEIGRLKTGALRSNRGSPHSGPPLPLENEVNFSIPDGECHANIRQPQNFPCFAAGDVRVNENSALSSYHILFFKFHNFLVEELHFINPSWKKNRLINTARLILSAVTQRITYKEFLPLLLGQKYLDFFDLNLIEKGYWNGYDSSYDATTSNAFATAAMRFGHTMLTSPLTRPSPGFDRQQGRSILLNESFSNAIPLMMAREGGVNSILRGLTSDTAEKADPTFVDDVHNFLFAEKGQFGEDLLARNIQRGRDHGLPGYNTYREFCGLKQAGSFEDLINEIPQNRINRLRQLYSRVEDIDLYIAGLAESPVEGGLFGPTFSCLLGYQFRDLRKGDRLWHENGGEFAVFTPAQLQAIRDYTLSRLLCDHTSDMIMMQASPFQKVTRSNFRRTCPNFPPLKLDAWRDPSSSELSTATTPEMTAWFPAASADIEFSAQELLSYLLVNRPDDVCENSFGSEERIIRGNKQYRFSCPPGSIRGTDFPNVDSSRGVWTNWNDFSSPSRSGGDDDESRDSPPASCVHPIAIQVFTTTRKPARQTGDVFSTFSPSAGFICRGRDQHDGRCEDYQVRYFCKTIRQAQRSPALPQDLATSKDRLCNSYGVCCA